MLSRRGCPRRITLNSKTHLTVLLGTPLARRARRIVAFGPTPHNRSISTSGPHERRENTMFQRRDFSHLIQAGGRGCSTALAASLLLVGVAMAQDSRSAASKPASPIPGDAGTPLNLVFTVPSGVQPPDA